ncbi:MAG: Holliday junction branch migration protein RuvA [Deltaproteobacteria bacterium]|nr:Holliday junction branch migration protein RuvA [Deltaproteobacteria bacterium]
MIAYLEGKLLAPMGASAVVLTPGGTGYQVFLPLPLMARLPPAGEPVSFYISTVVRADELSLYGFDGPEGKQLFETLMKVSGVGPKVALAVMAQLSPAKLVAALMADDVGLLSTIPGIGKKTAQRLCLELKDRLASWGPSASSEPGPEEGRELASALTNLGFMAKDVYSVIQQLPADGAPFSDQLRRALAKLAKHP